MTRAERRRAVREEDREARQRAAAFQLSGDETCDQCGRHLDDGPPDLQTLTVDVGGKIFTACAYCAPALRQVVDEMLAGHGPGPRPRGIVWNAGPQARQRRRPAP